MATGRSDIVGRMRSLPLAPLAAAVALVTLPARADLGPPPSCPKGQHHEYLYGHRCVPDGSHLEPDPQGGVKTVPDKGAPTATPTAAPAPTPPPNVPASPTAPTATPASTATSADPVPPAPPPSHGCACSIADERTSIAGLVAGAAAAAIFLRRRRSR
jgi:MYXO-CTERM domain-containing protein